MHITFDNDKDLNGSTFLPEGTHTVTITGTQDTTSHSGNPMTVVVMTDALGRTCADRLVATAKWKFALLGKAIGMSKELLKAEGLNTANLQGCQLTVVREKDGTTWTNDEGKTFDNLKTSYVPAESTTATGTSNEMTDDIPF